MSRWWRDVPHSFLQGFHHVCRFSNRGCWHNLADLQTCRETVLIICTAFANLHRQLESLDSHRLSADRTVNGRLLLLLQFSSATFFPIDALALLLSSSRLPETLSSEGLLSRVPISGTAAWKNLCRADCVFWAEGVQGSGGGVGLAGFTTISTGASSTEEGRGAGSGLPPLFNCLAEMAAPNLISHSEEDVLQLFWWALQIKVSGSVPGL